MDEISRPDQENELDELASLFGQTEDEYEKIERTILNKNLDGFASCFPNWDLHPPVIIRTPGSVSPVQGAKTETTPKPEETMDSFPGDGPVQETGTSRRKRR